MPWYRMVKYFNEEKGKLIEIEGSNCILFADEDDTGNPNMVAAVCPIHGFSASAIGAIGEEIKKLTGKNVLILGDNIGLFKIEPVTNAEAKKIITKEHGSKVYDEFKENGGPAASAMDTN